MQSIFYLAKPPNIFNKSHSDVFHNSCPIWLENTVQKRNSLPIPPSSWMQHTPSHRIHTNGNTLSFNPNFTTIKKIYIYFFNPTQQVNTHDNWFNFYFLMFFFRILIYLMSPSVLFTYIHNLMYFRSWGGRDHLRSGTAGEMCENH